GVKDTMLITLDGEQHLEASRMRGIDCAFAIIAYTKLPLCPAHSGALHSGNCAAVQTLHLPTDLEATADPTADRNRRRGRIRWVCRIGIVVRLRGCAAACGGRSRIHNR